MGSCTSKSSTVGPLPTYDYNKQQKEKPSGMESRNYKNAETQTDEISDAESKPKVDIIYISNPLKRWNFCNCFAGMINIENKIEVSFKKHSNRIEKDDANFSKDLDKNIIFKSIKNIYEEKVGDIDNNRLLIVYATDCELDLQNNNNTTTTLYPYCDIIMENIDYSIAAIAGYYYNESLYSNERIEIKEGCYTIILSLRNSFEMRFVQVEKNRNIYVKRIVKLNKYSQFNRMKILKKKMEIYNKSDDDFFKDYIDIPKNLVSYCFENDEDEKNEVSKETVNYYFRDNFNDILKIREETIRNIFNENRMDEYVIYLNQKIVDMDEEFLKCKLPYNTKICIKQNYEYICVGAGVIGDKELFSDYTYIEFICYNDKLNN